MEIIREQTENKLTLFVKGRVDTTNANQLDEALVGAETYEMIVLDFSNLEYISSVGLRILLSTHKKTGGKLVISHANEFIMEVFDLTGFSSILNFKD